MDRFYPQITSIRRLSLTLPFVKTRQRLKYWAYAACFALGLLIPWIGMQYQGVPTIGGPLAHARTLAAETFAGGRLANNPLVGGYFFQTYLVLQDPSYSAAVAPGPSLLLSVGYLISDPLFGLWLSSALFSLATAWMLKAFTSLRWAVIGSFFVTVWFGALSYWGQSFEGSAAAACGMAISWGASRRYQTQGRGFAALYLGMGLGWACLCDPRAACFALPVPAFLALRAWWKRGRPISAALLLLVGLVPSLLIQGLFNRAATGGFLTSPRSVYSARYDNNPVYIWESREVPPEFDFPRMEEYDLLVNELGSILPPPVGSLWLSRFSDCLLFYAGLPAILVLVGGLWLGLSRWTRWQLAGAVVSFSSVLLVLSFDRSVAAGLACAIPLLLVNSLRRIWTVRRRQNLDNWRLGGAIVLLLLAATISRGLHLTKDADVEKHLKYQNDIRSHLLESEGDRHVVIVQYIPPVPIRVEYVYNSANPEAQDIIWARWTDQVEASAFFDHYKGRKMWLLAVTADRLPELRPFKWVEKQAQSPDPAFLSP